MNDEPAPTVLPALRYRAADDCFVITDATGAVIGETNATDMSGRKALDPEAAKIGLRRFVTFAEWQVRVSGTVLWPGSAEDAQAHAPRV